MADALVKDEALPQLLTDLASFEANCPTSFAQSFEKWLKTHKQSTEGGDIFLHKEFVGKLLQNKNAKELMSWAKSYDAKDEWEKGIIKNIVSACPTSLGLIYALEEKSKRWSINESFYNEWNVASQCGVKGDFLEGVRALLIDKDNQPKWNPATVEELTTAYLDSHFVSPRDDGKNPLEFLKN